MMVGRRDSQAFRCFINDFRAQREVIGGGNIYVDGDTSDYVYWYAALFWEKSPLILIMLFVYRFDRRTGYGQSELPRPY